MTLLVDNYSDTFEFVKVAYKILLLSFFSGHTAYACDLYEYVL